MNRVYPRSLMRLNVGLEFDPPRKLTGFFLQKGTFESMIFVILL